MRSKLALGMLFLVCLSASATAFTFGPVSTFAQTRSGTVSWASNATIETNSLVVRADDVVIGSQRIDLHADGAQRVLVTIEQWSIDSKKFTVAMLNGSRTGLNLTWSNPGENLTVWQAGINTHTCSKEVTPCTFVFPNASTRAFSILTPSGAQALTAEQATTPPPAEAGGGSSGAVVDRPRTLADIPHPADRFPHLSPLQWLVVIVCIALILNAFPQTQPYLPVFLHVHAPPEYLLGAGTVGLVLLYLTPS